MEKNIPPPLPRIHDADAKGPACKVRDVEEATDHYVVGAQGVIFRRIVRCAFVAVVESGEGYFIAYKEPAPVGFYEGAGVAEFGVIYREPVHQCLSGEAKPLRRVTLGD